MSWRKELTRLRKKSLIVSDLNESLTAGSSDEEDIDSIAEHVGEVAAVDVSNSDDSHCLWPLTDRVLKNERERPYCCHICFHRGDYRSNHMRHLKSKWGCIPKMCMSHNVIAEYIIENNIRPDPATGLVEYPTKIREFDLNLPSGHPGGVDDLCNTVGRNMIVLARLLHYHGFDIVRALIADTSKPDRLEVFVQLLTHLEASYFDKCDSEATNVQKQFPDYFSLMKEHGELLKKALDNKTFPLDDDYAQAKEEKAHKDYQSADESEVTSAAKQKRVCVTCEQRTFARPALDSKHFVQCEGKFCRRKRDNENAWYHLECVTPIPTTFTKPTLVLCCIDCTVKPVKYRPRLESISLV